MKKCLLLSIIITLLCISCKPKVEQKLIGSWSIDVLDAPNIFENFLTNIITFNSDGTCLLPPTLHDYEGKGTWTLNVKDSTVTFYTANNPLGGTYNFSFKKDENNKLLKLILNSKDVKLTCSKGLYNFDKDKNF